MVAAFMDSGLGAKSIVSDRRAPRAFAVALVFMGLAAWTIEAGAQTRTDAGKAGTTGSQKKGTSSSAATGKHPGKGVKKGAAASSQVNADKAGSEEQKCPCPCPEGGAAPAGAAGVKGAGDTGRSGERIADQGAGARGVGTAGSDTDRTRAKTGGDDGDDGRAGADGARAKTSIQGGAQSGTVAGYDDRKQLNELSLPPTVEAARQDVSEELHKKPVDKAGPFMGNVKLGPGIGFGGAKATLGVQLDLGYAVVKGDARSIAGGDLYIVASPEFQFGTGVVLALPLGVQYDIPTPVVGLYVYPRTTLGYSIVVDPGEGDAANAFAITPALGLKYVINRTMNVGIEPFVLPIYLSGEKGVLEYRMFGYAGLNL